MSPSFLLRGFLLLSALPFAACERSVNIQLAVTGTDAVSGLELPLEAVKLLSDSGGLVSLAPSTQPDEDLLDVDADALFPVVQDSEVDEGNYTGLALSFDEHDASVTQTDGTTASVYIPEAEVYAGMSLPVEDDSALIRIVVLDLRFSLSDQTETLGSWYLRPYYRVVDPDSAGTVAGAVTASFVTSTACKAGRDAGKGVTVYAFAGSDVTPRDFATGDSGSPVASAPVTLSGSTWSYSLPYLAVGDYTLALTCEGDAEDALLEQGLTFYGAQDASIAAGATAAVNFDPE